MPRVTPLFLLIKLTLLILSPRRRYTRWPSAAMQIHSYSSVLISLLPPLQMHPDVTSCPWTLGCGKESFMLAWRCSQLQSDFLANGYLFWVSRQSDNGKGDNSGIATGGLDGASWPTNYKLNYEQFSHLRSINKPVCSNPTLIMATQCRSIIID